MLTRMGRGCGSWAWLVLAGASAAQRRQFLQDLIQAQSIHTAILRLGTAVRCGAPRYRWTGVADAALGPAAGERQSQLGRPATVRGDRDWAAAAAEPQPRHRVPGNISRLYLWTSSLYCERH